MRALAPEVVLASGTPEPTTRAKAHPRRDAIAALKRRSSTARSPATRPAAVKVRGFMRCNCDQRESTTRGQQEKPKPSAP
jgi:hypothetical protein